MAKDRHVPLDRRAQERLAFERAEAKAATLEGTSGPYAITQTGGRLHLAKSDHRTWCGAEIKRRLRRNPHRQLVRKCRACTTYRKRSQALQS